MRYLPACLESVFGQTYPHYEVVVLDSGSTDDSMDYISGLKRQNLKIIGTNKRLYIEENWARIVTLPLQEYATILGQDDTLDPHFLQDMVDLIEKHPKASLFSAPFRFINEWGNTIRDGKKLAREYQVHELATSMLQLNIDISATGFVFRSQDYQLFGGIPLYTNLLYSDYALWLGLTQKGYLVMADRASFAFRIHTNTSQTTSGLKYLEALEAFVPFLKKLSNENALFKKSVETNIAGYVSFYGQMMVHRVLAMPNTIRDGNTVQKVINRLNVVIDSLGGESHPGVLANKTIRIAAHLDRLSLARWLFRFWRKWRYGR